MAAPCGSKFALGRLIPIDPIEVFIDTAFYIHKAPNMTQTAVQKTILVIEDEPNVQEVVADMVDLLGHRSIIASSGIAGLELYQTNGTTIDLIVLDLTMPGMSGEETYQRIRTLDATVPVVISSGHSRNQISDTFGNANQVSFLPKPYDYMSFEATISSVLNRVDKASSVAA